MKGYIVLSDGSVQFHIVSVSVCGCCWHDNDSAFSSSVFHLQRTSAAKRRFEFYNQLPLLVSGTCGHMTCYCLGIHPPTQPN